jgi:REP element-mobilizing transposase RayT
MSGPSLPIVRAGGWYHAVNRGVDGSVLFATQRGAAEFVEVLGEVAGRFAVEIHAYCAMGTHYHLLARAEEQELLRATARLEAEIPATTDRARLRRMAVGRHLLAVTRYIHRNPVHAGLVRRPVDWPWSSYRGYLDPAYAPHWLRSDVVLGWLGSIGVRQRYRRYVEDG